MITRKKHGLDDWEKLFPRGVIPKLDTILRIDTNLIDITTTSLPEGLIIEATFKQQRKEFNRNLSDVQYETVEISVENDTLIEHQVSIEREYYGNMRWA